MRDYAELVKALRTCKMSIPCTECPFYSNGDEPSKECATMNVAAADAIEELLAKDTNVPNKWISVEERLPEDSGYAIVFCADGNLRHVTFAKYLKTPKRWELSGARSYWRVLNWMPLPEPPKGVE